MNLPLLRTDKATVWSFVGVSVVEKIGGVGMLNFRDATERATQWAIATGDAVNLHIIHASQSNEGYEPCFGRAVADCDQTHCAYHEKCMALVKFDKDYRDARVVSDSSASNLLAARRISAVNLDFASFGSVPYEPIVPDVLPVESPALSNS